MTASPPINAIEKERRKAVLVAAPLLSICALGGLWVIMRGGGYFAWEPWMFSVGAALSILVGLTVLLRPKTTSTAATVLVTVVYALILGRIATLFASGAFLPGGALADQSMFISIFAYIPMVYMGVYLMQDPKIGLRISVSFWVFYLLFLGYYGWEIWQINPNREGLDHLLIYSLIAHPTVLFMMTVVPHYSAALEESQSNLLASEEDRRGLARAALTDSLTGLPNRRFFDDYLVNAWRESLGSAQPLGLLMVDVDRFKAYNDLAGHQKGDQCLRRVAQAMRACLPSTAKIARYGGEEFVVVAPNISQPELQVLAEKVRFSVSHMELVHPAPYVPIVTVSVGAARIVASPELNVRTLIATADSALYRAKETGRNRCELAA